MELGVGVGVRARVRVRIRVRHSAPLRLYALSLAGLSGRIRVAQYKIRQ